MTAKLASGIKLKDYVVSYGSRPNNFDNAAACEYFPFILFGAFVKLT